MQRLAREAAQAVEHGAFDQADAEMGQQRRDAPGVRPSRLCWPIQLAPEIEKRHRLPRDLLGELSPRGLITSSISGRSCSNVVAGFFVNHFGGRPSAAEAPRGVRRRS